MTSGRPEFDQVFQIVNQPWEVLPAFILPANQQANQPGDQTSKHLGRKPDQPPAQNPADNLRDHGKLAGQDHGRTAGTRVATFRSSEPAYVARQEVSPTSQQHEKHEPRRTNGSFYYDPPGPGVVILAETEELLRAAFRLAPSSPDSLYSASLSAGNLQIDPASVERTVTRSFAYTTTSPFAGHIQCVDSWSPFGTPAYERLIRRAFTLYEFPSLIEAISSGEDKSDTADHLRGDDAQTLIDVIDEARSPFASHCDT